MFIENHNNVCFQVLDFMSQHEVSSILNNVKQQDDWNGAAQGGFWDGKISSIYTEDQKNIENRINNLFIDYDTINPLDNISRFFPGDSMGEHQDNTGSDKIAYGIILYLNDNYEGGELYYPEHDIKIKPKAGSMMFHKADVPHQVLEVTEGVRYFMTTFVNQRPGQQARVRSLIND